MTIHHPDWMDRHFSGSRQDTHGTLGPVSGWAVGGSSHVHRARHQVYLHNMVAEHDPTHWCQNGWTNPRTGGRRREERHFRNAGDVQGARAHQANDSGDLWRLRPDGKTQVTHEADNEQDEARGGGQHRRFSSQHSQERFPGMTISDELLQMIEKMSEKPDKERTITTARA